MRTIAKAVLGAYRVGRAGAAPVVVLALGALAAGILSTPAWAPEDPWRLVAEVPIVRGTEPTTAEVVAGFMLERGLELAPGQIFAIADSIDEQSRRYGIDPALLLAVIRMESGFRPDAISEKGAIGLMQLLPSTASYLAGEMKLKWRGDFHLLDPETNIALGAYYLKRLMKEFDHDLSLALTAYNKGPGYVQRMQASGVMEATASGAPSAYAEQVVDRMTALGRRSTARSRSRAL